MAATETNLVKDAIKIDLLWLLKQFDRLHLEHEAINDKLDNLHDEHLAILKRFDDMHNDHLLILLAIAKIPVPAPAVTLGLSVDAPIPK